MKLLARWYLIGFGLGLGLTAGYVGAMLTLYKLAELGDRIVP